MSNEIIKINDTDHRVSRLTGNSLARDVSPDSPLGRANMTEGSPTRGAEMTGI